MAWHVLRLVAGAGGCSLGVSAVLSPAKAIPVAIFLYNWVCLSACGSAHLSQLCH